MGADGLRPPPTQTSWHLGPGDVIVRGTNLTNTFFVEWALTANQVMVGTPSVVDASYQFRFRAGAIPPTDSTIGGLHCTCRTVHDIAALSTDLTLRSTFHYDTIAHSLCRPSRGDGRTLSETSV